MELAFPRVSLPVWVKDAATIICASILIGLTAPFAIPLPFNPVPIVIQNHVVRLVAAVLGSRRGTLAVVAFLAQALIGLPVLASGKMGMLAFAGPTGGYLIGYIASAYLVGRLLEKRPDSSSRRTFAVFVLSSFVIYLFGALHLAQFVGLKKAVLMGVLPFMLGDLLKTTVCVRLLQAFRSRVVRA